MASAGAARGAPDDPSTEPPPAAVERVEVVLAIAGEPGESVRSGLAQVLEVGLRGQGLMLVVRDAEGELGAFAERAAAGERTLMVALLDASKPSGWRLIVIDAARDRAIARDLSGGIEQNAASVEAVASIVLSATSALREGLEVASSPTESVVAPSETVRDRSVPARGPTESKHTPEPRRAFRTISRVTLGGEVSSFSSERPPTVGFNVAYALIVSPGVELRAALSYHPPVSLDTTLGGFEIDRFHGALSAGPYLPVGKLILTPAAGLATESLRRRESTPVTGVAAQPDSTVHRFGGLLVLRGRYPTIPLLSLEVAGGAAYFPQAVHFVTEDPGRTRLVDLNRAIFFAQLGFSGVIE